MRDDDEVRDAPPVVVAAVSFGTVPLPFLAVYAVLFILHGWFAPVNPPDITSSQTGELVAGLIATAAFIVMTVALLWFLNRRRRWPFAITELAIVGLSIWFLTDATKGGPLISAVVLVATLAALVFGFAPDAWLYLDRNPPRLFDRVWGVVPRFRSTRRTDTGDASALPRSTEPTLVPPASLRRRKSSSPQ
ncbi:MAG: hypothetical protein ACR2LX_07065 [Jatrophihabitans sp.]